MRDPVVVAERRMGFDSGPPVTKFARSADAQIAYQTFGSGPRNLVVIPGWISHVQMGWTSPGMREVFNRLGSFARVAVFDKRGTGLSDRNLGIASLDERTDDARAVMVAAGMDRAHVLGWSEGGPMALLMAASFPEQVDSLVIYGAPPTWRAIDGVPGSAQAAEFASGMLAAVETSWGTGEGLHWWVGSEHDNAEARVTAGQAWLSMVGPSDAAQIMRLMATIDVRELLPLVHCPVLVMAASRDQVAPPESCRWMAERLPNAQYVEIDGPHLPWTPGSDVGQFLDPIETFITGAEPVSRIERLLGTVLFTDIVASTQIAAELHDQRWRQLLESHDTLAAATIERHGGRLVKSTGDGVLALFDGPGHAVRCALALRDSVRGIGIDIRAGVHTGEVEVRRDGDISGIAVNLASRVETAAQPGEVLATRTVTELTLGSDLVFASRGEHELKGIPGSWELFTASR